MQYFVSMVTVLWFGLIIVLLGAIVIAVWMAYEYFSIKGHFDPYESLIGQIGTVKQECSPHKRGKVYVIGAYWDAVSEFGSVGIGDEIKVVGMKERLLIVQKVDLLAEKG